MQTSTHRIEPFVASAHLKRFLCLAAAVAALSLMIAVAGRFLGHTIALGGHTEDTSLREIVIGNNVLELPSNMIRFGKQRRSGVAERVDLYLHWPDMQGYKAEFIEDFNGLGTEKRIVFATFEPRATSHDMSGRYGPIYSILTSGPGITGPDDLTVQPLRADSGFANEEVVVSPQRAGQDSFVARCLDAEVSKNNLASCQRDIFVGEDLQLTYRFPRELLKDWRQLEQQMQGFAKANIKG